MSYVKTRKDFIEVKRVFFNWRVTEEEKELIKKAAAIRNQSAALFVMEYIIPRARKVIEQEEKKNE